MFHLRKETPSIQNGNPKTGTRKIRSREGNASGNYGKPSLPEDFTPFPGIQEAVPRRAPFDAPRSPSSAAAPILSPVTPRAAVWGRRGAVARPREARWRLGEPVPRGVFLKKKKFVKIPNDVIATNYYYRIVLKI